jgi:zinc and cadmium transporter
MTLLWIILATLAGGVLSVLAAASLSLTVLGRWAPRLVSFSVGVLLAAAFLHLIPEASHVLDPQRVGATVLAGLFLFFALEKSALWRHDHAHGGHSHATSHPHSPLGLMVVLGDGLHNFVDGVLIAAAFLADPALGWATTLAVIAHEIPQEVGDFMVLLDAGYGRARALALNVLSSLGSVLGGVLGWFALRGVSDVIPYALALAAASFIYIAVADLVPALQRHRRPLDFAAQFALLSSGVGVVLLGAHSH